MGLLDWLFGGGGTSCTPPQIPPSMYGLYHGMMGQSQAMMNQQMGMGQMNQMFMPFGHPRGAHYGNGPIGAFQHFRTPQPPAKPRPIMIICKYCNRRYKINEAPDSCKGCGAPVERYSE
jgi:hypothetical protein